MLSPLLRRIIFFSLILTGITLPVHADEPAASTAPKVKIDWVDGPVTAKLGEIAEVKIPQGYRFTGKDGTRKFLELTGNPPNGNELGTIVPDTSSQADKDEFYFVIFEFSGVGYVKDDDRDKLDADALLKSIQEGTEESNKERAKHGWDAFHITGWSRPPFYDTATRNLTWATEGYSVGQNKQEKAVNYSVRLLGRRGTMNVDLILEPQLVGPVVPKFNALLAGFSFLPGGGYSDFRAGDKVAEYGLATLVAGGATAIAAKTGLLAKLWKLIVAAIAALLAFLKRAWNYFKRVLSGKASDETPQQG
jgi:uncharacterized membrane-anchored protein